MCYKHLNNNNTHLDYIGVYVKLVIFVRLIPCTKHILTVVYSLNYNRKYKSHNALHIKLMKRCLSLFLVIFRVLNLLQLFQLLVIK